MSWKTSLCPNARIKILCVVLFLMSQVQSRCFGGSQINNSIDYSHADGSGLYCFWKHFIDGTFPKMKTINRGGQYPHIENCPVLENRFLWIELETMAICFGTVAKGVPENLEFAGKPRILQDGFLIGHSFPRTQKHPRIF